MARINIELSEKARMKLLEIQLDRKKNKIEPTAINKIAAELLDKCLEKENPTK